MKSRSPLHPARIWHRAAADPASAPRATRTAGGDATPFADSPRMVAQRQALACLAAPGPEAGDAALAGALPDRLPSLPVQRMPKRRKRGGGQGGAVVDTGGGGSRGGGGGLRGGRGKKRAGGRGGGRGGGQRNAAQGGNGQNRAQPAYQAFKSTIDEIRELKTDRERDALSPEQLEGYIQALQASIDSRSAVDAEGRDARHLQWTKGEQKLLRQMLNTKKRKRGR